MCSVRICVYMYSTLGGEGKGVFEGEGEGVFAGTYRQEEEWGGGAGVRVSECGG